MKHSVSEHYENPRVHEIINLFSTYNGGIKSSVFDNKGWYKYRKDERCLLNPLTTKDYKYMAKNVDKRILGTLNYFRPSIFSEWQKRPWDQNNNPGGLEDTLYYMLSIDVDLANDYTVDDEIALNSLIKAGKFIDGELQKIINEKFLIVFSGNGIYFHLHPEFACADETNDERNEKHATKLQSILDEFNLYLQDLEKEMFKEYPELHGIVKVDAINSKKRVFKLPLTFHKKLPYIVYPICRKTFEIPLKTSPLSEEDCDFAETLITDFFDKLPTPEEQNQLQTLLKSYESHAQERQKEYKNNTVTEKPAVPIPIQLIKREIVCEAIFSPESWPKGNTRRVAFMVSVLGRCGWNNNEIKSFVDEIASNWNVNSLEHVIDSWMDFDPPNIETIYNDGQDYPEMKMGELLEYLPPKPNYFHVIDKIFRIAQKEGYNVPSTGLKDVETEMRKINLKYRTEHLSCFADLATSTSLIGKEYTIIFKVLWYSLVSFKIAKTRIKVGQIEVDGRISPLFVLPAGRGKGQIKNVIKNVISGLNAIYGEPTSLHGEQLVGKTVRNKDDEFNHNFGYLADDYMVIDEAYQLLTSNDLKYSEARKYIRVALDPFPNNTVHKRTTDYGRAGALEFEPSCPIALFVQPFKLDNDILVLEGDIRRFTIAYSLIKSSKHEEPLTHRIFDESDNKESLNKFIDFLYSCGQAEPFDFTYAAKQTLAELSLDLANRGSSYSVKIANLNDSIIFTSQNTLVKFSAIQAFQQKRSVVEEIDVIFAYLDLFEILEHTYKFIEAKIPGSLDYGEGWNGAVHNDQKVLRWLQEKEATSKAKAIPKQDYLDKIMDVFEIQKRQAETVLKKHYELHEWIGKTKKDKNVYLWLKFNPEDCNNCNMQSDTTFQYEKYIQKYELLIEKSKSQLQIANIAIKQGSRIMKPTTSHNKGDL